MTPKSMQQASQESSPNARARGCWAWIAVAVLVLAPSLAASQVAGTDCACSLTGAYVSPDPGVRPVAGAVSPGGAFRVEGGTLPGPITVVRQSDDVAVLQVHAGGWGWSPDGDRILITLVSGSPPDQLQQYWLYDIGSGPTQAPIWHAASTLWGSTRVRFSEDGAVFFFAGLEFNSQVQLQALELATGAFYATSFSFYNPPDDLEDDSDPLVAGWGFGPDPTRLAYGYVTGQDSFTRAFANVHTGEHRGLASTGIAEVALFSPCGDVFGEKRQQFAGSGEVSVSLYATLDPAAAGLGSQGFPDGLEVEVRANTDDHVGLLGGFETTIAINTAGDVCVIPNQPPAASFDPPSAPIAGVPAVFSDTSSDSDGTIATRLWDFGDGTTATTANPSHTYAEAGAYVVRLTVTDDDGDSDFVDVTVLVCGDVANATGQLLFSTQAGLYGDGFNRDLLAYDVHSLVTVQITDSDWCRTSGVCYAQNGGSGTSHGARFSPDGASIAMAPATYGENGIWVMDADGRNRRRLTDGTGSGLFDYHRHPAWSPDGEWIVFENWTWDATNGYTESGLYRVRSDGTELAKIPGTLIDPDHKALSPDFLPSIAPECGALPLAQREPACYRVAYVRRIDGLPPADTIWSVRGDGSEPGFLVTEVGIYNSMRVSPDGARLAIGGEELVSGQFERGIYVFDLAVPGAVPQRITPAERWSEYPVWSPDGQAIAYQAHTVDVTPIEYDVYTTDPLGCSGALLRGEVGPDERPHDWTPGSVVQGPVSLSGQIVSTDMQPLSDYSGILLALSGDAAATLTPDAAGRFVFDDLPAGGSFFLSVVAAPGFLFDPAPIPIELGGSAVGVRVLLEPDIATIEGVVQLGGELLEGITIRADGPGGPFDATTDAAGHFVLSTRKNQTYTLSSGTPGYRLEPETSDVYVSAAASIDLVAVAVPVVPAGKVVFTSDRDGDEEIYRLDLASGVQTNLTNEAESSDRDPAWSPDGTRIAFASTRNGGGPEIFLMDAEGANVVGINQVGFEPAWSTDGAWLAYATDSGIQVYEIASMASYTATLDPSDRSPRWFTNYGFRVAFARTLDVGGSLESDLFEVDMSSLYSPLESPLVEQPGDDLEPAFIEGPFGSQFAYATQYGDLGNDVGIHAEGPGGLDRTSPGRNPSWSPDGAQVVYDDGGSLWIFEPGSGTTPIRVTDTGTGEIGADSDPDWWPVPEPGMDLLTAAALATLCALRARSRSRGAPVDPS